MKTILSRYERELTQSVIPFWEKHCIDREKGGYFNMIDRDGSIFDTDKYAWMQWRIVYMFATLAGTRFAGDSRNRWIDIAKHGFDFMWKNGRDESDSYYFALNRQGRPIIAPYNIGSEFFAIMACASLFKATGDDIHRDAALASVGNVLGRMENPKGQWNKRLSADKKRLAHDTHMATINVGLVLGECIDVPGLGEMVGESIELILDRFYRPEFGVVFENLNQDFSIDLESCDGRLICPGHALESAWFILKYANAKGRPDLIGKTCTMIKTVLDKGWDREFGGIYYFMDALGKPSPNLDWDMKLWWVHAEALVAVLSGYEASGDETLLDWFGRIDEWTWRHFPDPEYGEWFGYLNRKGDPVNMLKGGKWKTFFHLPRALMECVQLLEKVAEKK